MTSDPTKPLCRHCNREIEIRNGKWRHVMFNGAYCFKAAEPYTPPAETGRSKGKWCSNHSQYAHNCTECAAEPAETKAGPLGICDLNKSPHSQVISCRLWREIPAPAAPVSPDPPRHDDPVYCRGYGDGVKAGVKWLRKSSMREAGTVSAKPGLPYNEVSEMLGKYLNTMVADLCIEGKGQYLRDLFSRYEAEMAAQSLPSPASQVRICGNCGLPLVDGETEEQCRKIFGDKSDKEVCQNCHQAYVCWFAPNEIWNLAIPDRVGMLCPNCFLNRAERAAIDLGCWRIAPEFWASSPAQPVGSADKEQK